MVPEFHIPVLLTIPFSEGNGHFRHQHPVETFAVEVLASNEARPPSHDDVIKWKHFRVTGPLCGNSPVVVSSLCKCQWRGNLIFFLDLRLTRRLSKPTWGWWFETPSRPLWRHYNVTNQLHAMISMMVGFWIPQLLCTYSIFRVIKTTVTHLMNLITFYEVMTEKG